MQKLGPIKRIITMTNEWFTNEKYKRNCIDMIQDAGYKPEIWRMLIKLYSARKLY